MLQGNQLTMLGLGNAATAGFGLGIHTRWHFDATLSWPAFGFDLYRRQASKGAQSCIDFLKITFLDPKRLRFSYDTGAAGKLTASATVPMTVVSSTTTSVLMTRSKATFTFTYSGKVRQFSINVVCASGTMTLKAYDGSMQVASTSLKATGTAVTLTVAADRINRVVFVAPTVAEIHQICWVPIVDGDWTKLASFNLPKDWAEANARLPVGMTIASRKPYKDAWPRLELVIKKIRSGILAEEKEARPRVDGNPKLEVNYIHLLQVAALDPNIARILGLYCQDETAAVGSNYDYKIAGNWKAAGSADHAWICFNLFRGALPAVTRPTGLASTQVEVPGGITGAMTSQTATALGWTITRTTDGQLTQTAPVMYHVFRQDLKPDGAWTTAKQLTKGRPVIAKAASTNARYYTDGPVALGAYRYKIAGIDIFGRQSTYSTTTTITLTDTVAPPSPIKVKAALTDPDDASPVDIDVSWSWSSAQRAQAGDAKLFRVYHQYQNLYPVDGAVTAVAAGSVSGTSDLTTDLDVAEDYSRFSDGFLFHRGDRYRVSDVKISGGAIIVTVQNKKDDSGAMTRAPAAATSSTASFSYLKFLGEAWKLKGRFLLKVDWTKTAHWQASYMTQSLTSAEAYSTTITGVPVSVDAATPTATVMAAVCCEDVNGNVGPLSVPVFVQVRNTTAPDAPAITAGENEYASKADWYGNSRYTVALPAAAAGISYEIFRATDAGLANAVKNSIDVTTELASELEGLEAYEDIDEADLKDWADETESGDAAMLKYRKAFMNIGNASSDFEDEFPGTGRNRYIYKVCSVDTAGNRGEFADAFVVHLHDVTPPSAPVVTSVVGGDRQITLNWARNQERDMAGYRVYRTTVKEDSSDIRAMDLASEITAGTQTYTDTVEGLTDYYYRLVAYDNDGNVSSSTVALKGRAYDDSRPDPPTWDTPTESDDGLVLTWTSSDANLACMVQRSLLDADDWENLSGWLDRGTYSYTDDEREDGVSYGYRLKVMDEEGRSNIAYNEITS